MSATTIIDTAPLGALIRYTDGSPKPPARFGDPVGRRVVQARMLAAYRRRCWDRGRARILRRTLETRLLPRGTPMPVIADVMGRRSLDTTVDCTKVDSA
jgi:hypothetical protein